MELSGHCHPLELISARYALIYLDPARTAQLLRQPPTQPLPATDAGCLWDGAWQLGTICQLKALGSFTRRNHLRLQLHCPANTQPWTRLCLGHSAVHTRLRRISIVTKPRQLHQHRRNPSASTSSPGCRSVIPRHRRAHHCHCAVKKSTAACYF
jgi:hypothetical protein